MSKVTNVMIGLLEEQAALLLRHIAVLKSLPHDGSESATVVVEAPKKKAKAPVDPNKPKRPLSGYQIFMAEHNGECKEKNPEANATAIMTMVAGAWSVLTPDQKESYLVRAEKLKEQYLVEMQKYVANKFKDGSDAASDVEVAAPKVKASKSAASSSSAAEPKKAAAPVPTPAPVAAPAATPKKDEEKSKKHKRSDSDDSEAVIFTAPETHDTDKKKKVSCCFV